MATLNEAFMRDPRNIAQARQALDKMSRHADGAPVHYATEFARPDNRLRKANAGAAAKWAFDHALKATSVAIGSGIPQDGWLLVTDAGVQVHTRRMIGDRIGTLKGTIPHEMIASISIDHGKKMGRNRVTVIFADDSEVVLLTKTRVTYPALSAWSALLRSDAPADYGDGPIFDPNQLEVQGH
ncbi:MAG: hypothetical protein ACRBI6_14270 [Acidimicrobiales bacterium]